MVDWIYEKFGGSVRLPLLLALTVNGIALLLSSNYVDGDAHTRVYMAIEWLRAPFFISAPNQLTWVFGPLHCYLNAVVLSIWNSPLLAPRVLSWLLTSLAIVPLYGSLRALFNRRAACFSALLFCFYTLFIHSAAIAVSEGINLFLFFLSTWFFLRATESGAWRDIVVTALALVAATMMRYDSWLLASFLTIWAVLLKLKPGVHASARRFGWGQLLLLGTLAHSFIILWLVASWARFGDPLIFMHYSGNLDAPVIAAKIAEIGKLKYLLYNSAFLPAVMFLSLPFTSLVLSLVGVWEELKRSTGSLLLWLLGVFVLFYFVTFVFSFERFPLARFTILPGAILLCFSGVGLERLQRNLRGARRALTGFLAIAVPLLVVVALGFFSRPGDSDWQEKLRAVSPLTNPPAYFPEMAKKLDDRLNAGADLVLDCRNFNDRLLYLYLSEYYPQIRGAWADTESLRRFIEASVPEFVLYTARPNRNHELFHRETGDTVAIAGLNYQPADSAGIFTLYQRLK